MSSPETATDQLPERNSPPNVRLWLLVTLAGAILFAFLAGLANPRVKLLGLFPLALGALTAFLSVELLKLQGLSLRKFMMAWVMLLSVIVPAGATYRSSRDWHDQYWDERKGFLGENAYQDFLEMHDEKYRDERYDYMLVLESKTSFQAYLSHRLEAFSNQLGREYVWDSPVPEAVFGIEQLLAALGAFVVSFIAYRSQRRSPNPKEPPS